MLKSAIAGVLVLGTVSLASAMPAAPTSTAASLPIVEAAVVVKKTTVVRHPAVAHRVVRTKTVIRR